MVQQCLWETDDTYQLKELGFLRKIGTETKTLAGSISLLCHTIESNKQNNTVPKQLQNGATNVIMYKHPRLQCNHHI